MIRKDREVTDIDQILGVIDRCKVIRLGFCDNGEVYIVPLNYGYTYEGGTLTFYFHGALKGRKYDVMRANNKVGFEMDCDEALIPGDSPCSYSYEYSSVIGTGVAEPVEEPFAKAEAARLLMKNQTGKHFDFTGEMVESIRIFKVTAAEFSCKRSIRHG